MIEATVRLMTESGVKGPEQTIEVPEGRKEREQVIRDWAAGQTGHPWDLVTVSIPGEPGYEIAP